MFESVMFTFIKKYIKNLLIAAILILVGVSFVFQLISDTNDTIQFSTPSGFYEDDFFLELMSSKGEIAYSINSSDVDRNSKKYSEPLLITDASKNPNVYSVIKDVNIEYKKEIMEQVGNVGIIGYSLPHESVDKATVVRASVVDKCGMIGETRTEVYWVGYENKRAYDGINIISIVTDPQNLFDYNSGIYVTGKYFDDFLKNEIDIMSVTPNYGWWPGNYTQRGRDWERKASIQLWNSNRELICSGNYGIRIQGGSSRGFANKSINIIAREEYGEKAINGTLLFSNGFEMRSMTLYNGAHASITKLPDYLANTLTNGLNISTREFEPFVLFLDGEFWGVYYLTPRYEKEFFEANYNVLGDDVVGIKNGNVEIGNSEDITKYNDMISWVSSNDMSVLDNYERVCDLIDIDSYLDYSATEIYIANQDWPENNYALWRTRDTSTGKYNDGRWRWILFDVNLSMSSSVAYSDWVEYAANKSETFASLLYNDDFKAALEERLVYLARNNFNPQRVNRFIDNYEALMADAMELEYKRFYGDNRTLDDFYTGCEDIRKFFNERYDYIMKTYGNGVS